MKVKIILCTLAFASQAFAQTLPPQKLSVCVNDFTGIVTAKKKCSASKGEKVFNANTLIAQAADPVVGPQGPKGDKGDKGDSGFNGSQGPQGPAGLPGSGGFDPNQCALRLVSGGNLSPNDDIAIITADCGPNQFLLTHGIQGVLDIGVQGTTLRGLVGTSGVASGVEYLTGKNQPQLSFLWTQSVGIVCCPI